MGLAKTLAIGQQRDNRLNTRHKRREEAHPVGSAEGKQRRMRRTVQRPDVEIGVGVQAHHYTNVAEVLLNKENGSFSIAAKRREKE